MIIPDYLLRKYAEDGAIAPYDPELINPASVDIRIGHTAYLLVPPWRYHLARWMKQETLIDNDYNHFVKVELNKDTAFVPGARLLVESFETFNIPDTTAILFRLKSSTGRKFWEHLEAGFGDPGWYGSKLTMELVNMSYTRSRLYPGMKIGQLIFFRMEGKPEKTYAQTGRYNNDTTVQVSKDE